MTAGQADAFLVPEQTGETGTLTSVGAIRSFVRGRRRRSWVDLYAIGFGIVIGLIYLSDVLTAPFSRLGGAAGRAAAQAAGGSPVRRQRGGPLPHDCVRRGARPAAGALAHPAARVLRGRRRDRGRRCGGRGTVDRSRARDYRRLRPHS
ncbi:MAG: hypothetical protein ABSA02_33940 [Trebonia sp.]